MHKLSPLAAAALILLPAFAAAQDKPLPSPLDAAHPVPPLSYESAFKQYQHSKEEKETPEKRWIGVNQQLMPMEKATSQARTPEGGQQPMHGGH